MHSLFCICCSLLMTYLYCKGKGSAVVEAATNHSICHLDCSFSGKIPTNLTEFIEIVGACATYISNMGLH